MQEEMRRRTREAPTGSQQEEHMKVRQTDIEAQKRKLGTGNRTKQQSKRSCGTHEIGQAEQRRMPTGCLIRHSTQRMGKP